MVLYLYREDYCQRSSAVEESGDSTDGSYLLQDNIAHYLL